ncbi:hypothetical protein ACF1BQ_028210 [Bradyrhizobium sp. RDT10]
MPPLSRITPLMLADALVEHRLLLGDELEAEAVVDHGKAPAGERGDARKLAGPLAFIKQWHRFERSPRAVFERVQLCVMT